MAATAVREADEGIQRINVPVGDELVNSVVGGMEADVRLAVRRRTLEANQARMRKINEDFRRLVNDLNANYSETEAGLVRIHIQGCREELIQCYLGVSPSMDTEAGRKKIEEVVDGVLTTTLSEIKPPEAVEDKGKRPTRRHAAQ